MVISRMADMDLPFAIVSAIAERCFVNDDLLMYVPLHDSVGLVPRDVFDLCQSRAAVGQDCGRCATGKMARVRAWILLPQLLSEMHANFGQHVVANGLARPHHTILDDELPPKAVTCACLHGRRSRT